MNIPEPKSPSKAEKPRMMEIENVLHPGKVYRVQADKFEAMREAYLKILPARLKRTAWFGRFDGTGMPVEQVTVDRKLYFAGEICKPHDCADNYLTFLIAADGLRAVAMVKARETSGQIVELGNPTTAERQFMAKEFQD